MSFCEGDLIKYASSLGISTETLTQCLVQTAKETNSNKNGVCATILEHLNAIITHTIQLTSAHKMTLKSYQETVLRYMFRNRGLVVAFGVGSGKTLTAASISYALIQQAKVFGVDVTVNIVTPVSLQDNFKKEMRAAGLPITKQYKFYTIPGFANAYKKGLIDCSKSVLIVDEAHNLKLDYRGVFGEVKINKTDSARVPKFIDCASKAWKVVLLTATPQYDKVYDMVNLTAMIQGREPLSAHEFSELISNRARFEKYYACMFAFYNPPRQEYPRREDHYLFIPMTPEVERKYNLEAGRQPAGTKRGGERSANSFMIKVRTATNKIQPCLKCDEVLRILSDGKKALVYSAFKSAGINIIKTLLNEHNISHLTISGDIKKLADRQKIVDAFNTGPVQVLFITKAGGEGLDLKRIRNVIILEKGWNQAGDEQVIGRAIRYRSHSDLPPSERRVDVYHLVMIKQGDYDLARKITNKQVVDENQIMKSQQALPVTRRISADLYLMLMGIVKQKEIDKIHSWLEHVSIFKNKACTQ
jgi:superfamily II DNA or RNA helicase